MLRSFLHETFDILNKKMLKYSWDIKWKVFFIEKCIIAKEQTQSVDIAYNNDCGNKVLRSVCAIFVYSYRAWLVAV